MGLIAIGDIHGCLTALQVLERIVPLGGGQTLITLGDYVDRGPQSHGVIEWLLRYRGHGGTLVSLLGNHELMMLEARRGVLARNRWLANGGMETLLSYAGKGDRDDAGSGALRSCEEGAGRKEGIGTLENVPGTHWAFLESCRPYFETEGHIFVHANLDPDRSLEEQSVEDLLWKKLGDPRPHLSGKHMICGHTPQRSGQPRALPHATCIDTLAYGGGWLTALEVETGKCWQANEEGEARTGYLEIDG